MSEIDWSKAPPEATHWDCREFVSPAFMKKLRGADNWQFYHDGNWHIYGKMSPSEEDKLMPRPSMIIDWSNAPEGATHFGPERLVEDYIYWSESFYRCVNDNNWQFHRCANEGWMDVLDCEDWRDRLLSLVERPAEQKIESWNGEGLPPVGTVCEHKRVHEWQKVEVFAVKPNYNGSETALFTFENGCWGGCAEPSLFRPIRTPEQIVAEERETELDRMVATVSMLDKGWARKVCGELYDAGYRKIQP